MQFSLNIDAGNTAGSLVATVSVNAGTYATAASFQTELQTDINAATTGNAGFTGAVTVKVTDLGSGVWTVNFKRNSTDAGTGIAISGVGSDIAQAITASGAATVANTGGGVFQVGANVTANEPDPRVDQRRPDHRRHEHDVHRAGEHRRHQHHPNAHRRQPWSTRRSRRCRHCVVSSVRTRTGSSRRSANLQVTTENLSASESRIRDTDMASEMVNFTKDQILLQAGTAMLAQANAAPQTILKLLQ